MTKSVRIGLFVVLSVGVLGGGVVYRYSQPIEREVEGRIVTLDAAARTATLEFKHPKTGESITLAGDVTPTCDIRIDGQAAQLADLKVGEKVKVKGRMYRLSNEVHAERVTANRATSQPASSESTKPQ